MSTLESLIRLHRCQVDDLQGHLAELDRLADRFRREVARLVEEREVDEDTRGASFLARHVYPGHVRRSLERQKTLERSLAEAEAEILRARDALAEASQRLRRYEIATAKRERLRMTAAARSQRPETRAIPIERFRRQARG